MRNGQTIFMCEDYKEVWYLLTMGQMFRLHHRASPDKKLQIGEIELDTVYEVLDVINNTKIKP